MNVFCPNCENECSEDAAACPKCGHPLKASVVHDVERWARKRGRGWWVRFSLALTFAVASVAVMVGVYKHEKASIVRCTEAMRASGDAHRRALDRQWEREELILRLANARGSGFEVLSAEELRVLAWRAGRIARVYGMDVISVCEVLAAVAGVGASAKEELDLCLLDSMGALGSFDVNVIRVER